MNNICLNGSWSLCFDENRELSFETYRQGTLIEVEVPGAVDRYLENRTYYGPFYYEKLVNVEVKAGKKYILDFKGVSYYCEVRINGSYVGEHEGVWDGFNFDITDYIKNGENRIVVRVIKPDFNPESKFYFRSVLFGFIPDVMLPFGGIWKDVNILEKSNCYFETVYPQFNMNDEMLEIEYKLNSSDACRIEIEVEDPDGTVNKFSQIAEDEGLLKLKPGNLILWGPDEPNLYKLNIKLVHDGAIVDVYKKSIGARTITTENGKILVNGKPIYLRGVLHWGYYPEIFAPNPSYETVKEELTRIKAMGFNGVKHCLYFPPDYYYELCDEMGILQWQELPLWLPYPNEYLLNRIYKQYPKMVKLFINHPSVVLISIGCELDATIPGQVLNELYEIINSKNSQAIICDNSGSGECYEGVKNGKSDIYDYHFYSELHNLETLINEFTQSYRIKKPWLFGEYNDIDTWRDMREIRGVSSSEIYWADKNEKKNLLRLTHKNQGSDQPVYMQEEILKQYGIEDKADGLKEISYKQAYDIRKYILELTRRYSAISGYNITNLRDVAITTSGIFDDFNNPKWSPEEFRKINGEMVLTYSKPLGRVWYRGGDRFLSRDLYNHFSGGTLSGNIILSNSTNIQGQAELKVELEHEGKKISENIVNVAIAPYDSLGLTEISLQLPEVTETESYKLLLTLIKDNNILSENGWNIWAHPVLKNNTSVYLFDNAGYFDGAEKYFNINRINSIIELKGQEGILVTSYFNREVEKLIEKGWKVFYIQQGYGFFPYKELPFWREGIRKVNRHRAVDSLKHNDYAGIQFFSLGTDIAFDRLELEQAIGEYSPIISRYDGRRFHVSEYMFQYSKGKGKAIVTSLRLQGGQGSQARSFEENILGVKILDNVIKYFTNV